MNEEELENLCLDWFRESGWDALYGPDIDPDGTDPQHDGYPRSFPNSAQDTCLPKWKTCS